MNLNSEILLKISFLSGAIPFVGGWGIFLAWMLGRYLNASDFSELEMLTELIYFFICFSFTSNFFATLEISSLLSSQHNLLRFNLLIVLEIL